MARTRRQRIEAANEVIFQVASFGRRFFYNETHDRVARFEQSLDGKLWFRDDYTNKLCYTAYRYNWRNFSHGGTMRSLIDALAHYIRTGEPISRGYFGPWRKIFCNGDLWGYGDDAMQSLRAAIAESPALSAPSSSGDV